MRRDCSHLALRSFFVEIIQDKDRAYMVLDLMDATAFATWVPFPIEYKIYLAG